MKLPDASASLMIPALDGVLLQMNPFLHRPSEIHDLRVAMTRLRVVLSAMRKIIRPPTHKVLVRDLRWMFQKLGKVREWDVLDHDLIGKSSESEAEESSKVRQAATRRRSTAMSDLHKALAGGRASRLRACVYGLRRMAVHSASASIPECERQAIVDFGGRALERRLRKVGNRSTLATAPGGLHRLRMQIKKLRYSAELFAPLFPGQGVHGFIARLEELQHELGSAHDASVERTQVASLQRTLRGKWSPALSSMADAAAKAEGAYTWNWGKELMRLHPFWSTPPAISGAPS